MADDRWRDENRPRGGQWRNRGNDESGWRGQGQGRDDQWPGGYRRDDDDDDYGRRERSDQGGYGGRGGYGQDYGNRGYGNQGYGGQGGCGRQNDQYSRGQRDMDYGGGDRDRGGNRDFWDRASDEVSSWFGNDSAERRRDEDRGNAGRGPKGYQRSDERIADDVNSRLTDDRMLDASDMEVEVEDGEVILKGTVDSREAKRRAEDIADSVSGIKHVQNNLRIERSDAGANTLGLMNRTSGSSASPMKTSSNGSTGTEGKSKSSGR